MALWSDDIRRVFWVAVIPAMISLGIMVFAVREPAVEHRAERAPFRLADIAHMPRLFWLVAGVATIFTLARFSEAFLILRAQTAGLPLALLPAVMVAMNIVYALGAYPVGALSDRIGRPRLLMLGIACLIAADLALAWTSGPLLLFVGVALWGLHMALTQSLFASLVADTAPPQARGTAFGIYNFLQGITLLGASLVAGALWDGFGPRLTFLAGAGFAAAAFLTLFFVQDPRRSAASRLSH
jgi:MFS family permease